MRRVVHATAAAILAASAMTAGASGVAEGDENAPPASVVKVIATQRLPDLWHPWRTQDPVDTSGTGVVVDGRRILTNAHVVRYGSRVLVQPYGSGSKLAARVEALDPGMDLAVLVLEDPAAADAFFAEHPPLPRAGELPHAKDAVLVYGFPAGGDDLAITKGIVSRIEYDAYYYGTSGLRVQVDAPINPGNSGGPALVGDRMIGVIFSRLEQSENVGYIIPNEEIDLFLADIADGKADGKPAMYDAVQSLGNPALRAKLGLAPQTTGVLVVDPHRDDAAYPLRKWDVITRIGPHEIDDAGMVRLGPDLRVAFRCLVQRLALDGAVPLEVVREGKPVPVMLPVHPDRGELIRLLRGDYPSYLVWGPLVFTPATEDFIHEFETPPMAPAWFPFLTFRQSPLVVRRRDRPRFDGEQLVMVAWWFPHSVGNGYADPSTHVVAAIDDTPVRNLRHLAETLRRAAGESVTITFADADSEVLVFDRRAILAATEEILSENGIRRPCSEDLKGIWTAGE